MNCSCKSILVGFLMLYSQVSYAQEQRFSPAVIANALSARRYGEALQLLAPQLKAHPQDTRLWTLRGLALAGLDRTSESLSSFDHALAIDPHFLPALEGATQTTYLRGDPRALTYVQKLLEVSPTNDVANAMAGAITYQSKDCVKSIQYFAQSGEQIYRDPRALDEFADCLLQQKQPEAAMRILMKGVQSHPDRVDLTYNLGIAQLRSHQPAAAIQTLSPFEDKRDSQLLNLLASAYMQAGKPDDAFRVLESAIELSPSDQTNYLDLAILCLEHNQEERSIKAATAGIGRVKTPASLYLIRGVAYAELAQYDKAEADFVSAAQIEPNQPHSTIAMSMLYSDRNQLDKEKDLLLKQLQTTPKDPVANYLLADLLVRSGIKAGQPAFEEAASHLAISLETRPDSVEAQVLMGHLLEEKGDVPGALSHYQQALQVEPDNHSALNREFILLRRLHRNDEADQALKHLKQVLNDQLAKENMSDAPRVTPAPPVQ